MEWQQADYDWDQGYLDWCSQSGCEKRSVTVFVWHERVSDLGGFQDIPTSDLFPCCEKCSRIYRGGPPTFIELSMDEVTILRVMST